VDHVIVDQHRLAGAVVPVDHHLAALGYPDRGGGVLGGVGQELTLRMRAIPIAIVPIDGIESDDAPFSSAMFLSF
jgi:hypothetical protein